MPSDLHGMVAMAAANTGTTVNEFITRAVSKELEHESQEHFPINKQENENAF